MIAEPGIQVRSPIGLLVWMRTEEKTANYNLGSRLKTPLYPIWLVVSTDQSGVLFSDDRNLLRDYRSEIRFSEIKFVFSLFNMDYCFICNVDGRFHLHYYTSSHHQSHPAVLLIRTRLREEPEEELSLPTLEKIIRTK